jgi:hypothetical protein
MHRPLNRTGTHDDDDHDDDGYLDLEQLARYSSLSVRTLQRHLKDPVHPLPHREVRNTGKGRGRVVVRKDEFHAWMDRFKPAAATDGPDVSWIGRGR